MHTPNQDQKALLAFAAAGASVSLMAAGLIVSLVESKTTSSKIKNGLVMSGVAAFVLFWCIKPEIKKQKTIE